MKLLREYRQSGGQPIVFKSVTNSFISFTHNFMRLFDHVIVNVCDYYYVCYNHCVCFQTITSHGDLLVTAQQSNMLRLYSSQDLTLECKLKVGGCSSIQFQYLNQ